MGLAEHISSLAIPSRTPSQVYIGDEPANTFICNIKIPRQMCIYSAVDFEQSSYIIPLVIKMVVGIHNKQTYMESRTFIYFL